MGKLDIIKNAVVGAANKVSDASGAHDLVDYASSKIAKGMSSPEVARNVDDQTSGRDALKSAGNLGLTVASIAAGGGAAGAAKAAAQNAVKRGVLKGVAHKARISGYKAAASIGNKGFEAGRKLRLGSTSLPSGIIRRSASKLGRGIERASDKVSDRVFRAANKVGDKLDDITGNKIFDRTTGSRITPKSPTRVAVEKTGGEAKKMIVKDATNAAKNNYGVGHLDDHAPLNFGPFKKSPGKAVRDSVNRNLAKKNNMPNGEYKKFRSAMVDDLGEGIPF